MRSAGLVAAKTVLGVDGDFIISGADVLLGELEIAGLDHPVPFCPVPFWMSAAHFFP